MYVKVNKSLPTAVLGILCTAYSANAQTGINTTSPDPNAVLDIVSTSKGVLIPRLSNTQVSILEDSSPENGMLIYNTNKNCVQIFTDTSFECVDISIDAWKDNDDNDRVELTYKSDGSNRNPGTEVVIKDNGRIGMGTKDPQVSLDIRDPNPSSPAASAGISVPQVSNLPSTGNRAGQIVYFTTKKKYYYYDGSAWKCLGCSASDPDYGTFYGDVKHSFQTSDHNGWVLLNGRAISSLPASQQAEATALGFSENLPDATDRVLKKKGALGSTSGTNSVSLTQANLPNVLFTGRTDSTGIHDHSFADRGSSSSKNHKLQPNGNVNVVRESELSNTTNKSGKHDHPFSVSSGGSGSAVNVENPYLSMNTFIYLGE